MIKNIIKFDENDLIPEWIPPLSNDKKLLEIRVDFFKNLQNKTPKYITLTYQKFIAAFEKSIKENQSMNISGLELFNQKDVIAGCLHFIDELIMTHGLDNIQLFEGGYNYYKKINPNIKYVTLDTLQSKKPLILEYPFPKYLGEHSLYKDIIKKCNELDIDVYLDCAWLPVSWGLTLNLDEPCIKGMAMSLSKCFGLHWSRIGVRWLKNETKDSIFHQNENRMISFPNLMIGKYYLDRLPMDYLITKYQTKYYKICEELSLKPSNIILASYSLDNKKLYGLKDLLLKNHEND